MESSLENEQEWTTDHHQVISPTGQRFSLVSPELASMLSKLINAALHAALTAERQRREQAEGAQHHMEACRSLLNVSNDDVLYEAIDDMQDQLLSAQAALKELQDERTKDKNLPKV